MTNHDRIEELILQTPDPVQRATLMLIARFDSALDANTAATQRIASSVETLLTDFGEHTERFDKHVVDEQKMLASAKGAWWATTILIAAVLALGGFIIRGYNDNVNTTLSVVQDLVTRVRVIEVEIKAHSAGGNGHVK